MWTNNTYINSVQKCGDDPIESVVPPGGDTGHYHKYS